MPWVAWLLIILALVAYLVYRFWPNSLARRIRYETFEGVSDEVLLRFIMAEKILGRGRSRRGIVDITWRGWERYEESNIDLVLRVIGGYGGLFWRLMGLGKFYFREVLSIAGNLTNARGWINDALRLGIIREEKDQYGVKRYVFDAEMIKLIADVLDVALEELIHG